MIICSLHGGFGNHILNTFLCIILHHYSKKHIHLISNKLSDDINIQRNDTRTAIYKLINSSILVNAPIFISSNSTFSIMASLFNKNIIYFPKFVDSGTVFPGIENTRYDKILNNPASNVIYIDIN